MKALGGYFVCSPRPDVFKVEIFDLKDDVSHSPLFKVIIYPSGNYCLVYTFGLDSVKSCDVTVENDPLAPYFKQGFLHI